MRNISYVSPNQQIKRAPVRLGADISHGSAPFSVRAQQRVCTDFDVKIWDVLESLTDIEEALYVLQIAEEYDTVTINLNCSGGCFYVGDALCMAMDECKAPIKVVATGRVASYATFILMSADEFEISPFCEILCHSASFGSSGKMADTKQHVEWTYEQCCKLINHYYEHFLTEEEISRIIDQKYEHYMSAEEFVVRFTRRVKALEAAMQEDDVEDVSQI